MNTRRYDPDKDKEAVHRVFTEVGWLDTENKAHVEAMDAFNSCGKSYVAELNGEAECFVNTHPGTIRHGETDLPMCGVTGVATSRIARKQGLAGRLTALAVAGGAADGKLVSGLGMFEQGFYNRLGFGTGTYVPAIRFDPANIHVKVKPRVPCRLTPDDFAEIHEARHRSLRRHMMTTIEPVEFTRLRMVSGFGLGYRGDDGRITHHAWFGEAKREDSPYSVRWVSFETLEQFAELMGMMKGLGDQVRAIHMAEPPGLQLQDFIRHPFRTQGARGHGEHRTGVEAAAYWQMRMNDLEGCLARTRLSCGETRFNLELADPITQFLKGTEWKGAGGEFVVTLGSECSARPGAEKSLPTLRASVNAFTRMWLGVLPATTLAISDDVSGEKELLDELDRAFLLPNSHLGWFF